MITGESAVKTTKMWPIQVVILQKRGREKLEFWLGAIEIRS